MLPRILLIASLCGTVAAQDLTSAMWDRIRPVYAKTIEHPFLKGLATGELPRERFDFYLAQDALYLSTFSRALSLLAAKAPREEWSLMFNRHAIEALEVERALHESLLGGKRAPVEMAPSNRAYTSHLIAAVSQRPFSEGLAAMLPCYWIYWEVGKTLRKRGSRDPAYQKWITQYASEEYGETVEEVLAIMSAVGQDLAPGTREACLRLFEISARYEYMFWDMAWREEQWPPQ